MKLLLPALIALIAASASTRAQSNQSREDLLSIPDVSESPMEIQKISEKEVDGVILEEIFINGAPFGGKPTKIYGYYAHPKEPGKYPGVVQLHGAGMQVLPSQAAVGYAKSKYVCLSLDWAGGDWTRSGKLRAEPRSEFESAGSGAVAVPDGDGDPKHVHYVAVEPAESSITNGVRFVRRGFQFLRSRKEVDADKLCLSGMSAGAHLSLLILGVEPGIKAAAVKYGSGFIRELNWGGYFGPVSIAKPAEVVSRWLDVLDPKHGFDKITAATLMLSGTDDVFFHMPAVLATWRAIPGRKALLMLPNDNHTQVHNEEIPRQWFDFVLNGSPAWPTLDAIQAVEKPDSLDLSVAVQGNVSGVNFWYKRMPSIGFNYKKANTPEETVAWKSVEAKKTGDLWTASLPALVAGEKIMVYATAEDVSGTRASSDVAEANSTSTITAASPTPPQASIPPNKSAGPSESENQENVFPNPSFEMGGPKKGRFGKLFLNFTGTPAWVSDAKSAHTGEAALQISAQDTIAAEIPVSADTPYKLSGWFRSKDESDPHARLQINWKRTDGSLIKFDIINPSLTGEYQDHALEVTSPADAANALLIIATGGGAALVDDISFGPP